MSLLNQNKAVSRKDAKRHKKKLAELLDEFFSLLDRKPKPSDEEVRTGFQRCELAWKTYCIKNRLDIRTSLLFNMKVSYEWERKYVKKSKP